MKKLLLHASTMLLLIVALLQSGCLKDSQNKEYPDVTANADTIHGIVKLRQTDTSGIKIVNWKYGAAAIKAIVGGNEVIASATVNADGTFVLILPATVSGNYFSSLADLAVQQGGSIKATPETVRLHGSTQFKVEYTDNGKVKNMMVNLYTLDASLSIDKTYYYNFYDLDGTFSGTSATGNIFNWTFTKGWGLVESVKINSSSYAFDSKSVNSATPDAIWVN
jgi:hypothetical protein